MRLTSPLLALMMVLSACNSSSDVPWQAEDQLKVVDSSVWVVGSKLVTLSPDAAPASQPQVGSKVRVSGVRTARGELVINTAELIDAPALPPEPTPRPTPRVIPPSHPTPTPAKKPRRNDEDNRDD